MADITIFKKKSGCIDCEKTVALLDDLGVEYNSIVIEDTPGALDQLKAAGFRAAPVVFANGEAWAGFKEDKLRALAA